MKTKVSEYENFEEFWPFYVSQHKRATNQFLHVFGSLAGLILGLTLIYNGQWGAGIGFGLILGYGCAWTGHFVFEKNRPATFRYPFYSFLGDFKMIFCLLTGRKF
jgi:hypothetical protein